ncbi:MAG: hypothetical protein FWD89_01675 [Firmicutes bacterium]|jgi:phosphoribosylaminoimidazole-succinocarboxamide synthase|nr:hypothetical protein [Bacillota bacterium]MCL2771000.1 hypothetical protein [Bacillota bacterium]
MSKTDTVSLEQYMAQQEKTARELFKEKGAKFLAMGKTKAVGLLPDGNVVMKFLDSFTGTAGVKDGGGNEVAGHMQGLGYMNLMTTWKIFKMMEEIGIPTQNISIDEANNLLIAKHVVLLGKGMPFEKDGEEHTSGGIEVIGRNIAMGSYLKRNPDVANGAILTQLDGMCMVETSVKNDAAGDPIFDSQYFIDSLYVLQEDLEEAINMTKQGVLLLTERFAKQGLTFADTKFEFGHDRENNVILVDEISTGTSRVLHADGKKATEQEVYEAVMRM